MIPRDPRVTGESLLVAPSPGGAPDPAPAAPGPFPVVPAPVRFPPWRLARYKMTLSRGDTVGLRR